MKILIFGGEASGKSAFAEDLALEMAQKEGLPLYYLATMDKNAGGDSEKRIEKHRKMREGKGFLTIERTKDLEKLEFPNGKGVILLEDIGNLVANELFTSKTSPASIDRHDQNTNYAVKTKIKSDALPAAALSASFSVYADSVARKIESSIEAISEKNVHIIAVGNNVFEDNTKNYCTEVHIYLQTLSQVNNIYAQKCDMVKEIYFGIPIPVK